MLSRSLLKEIRNLQQKKHRKLTNCFVAEGSKVAEEFLNEGWKPVHVVALPQWLRQHEQVLHQCRSVHEVDEHIMQRVTGLKTPTPVLLVLQQRWYNPAPADLQQSWTLALDTITDPGNLGTIIRIADWFAIKHVVCSPGCAEAYAPKVVQASMGSLARIRMVAMQLRELLEANHNISAFGTDPEGKTACEQWQVPSAGILVIGNESRGISPDLFAFFQDTIRIKRYGKAESLNAATATAILCYQLRAAQK
ncbi:MAG: RNA methyltransferase [Chitinophagales bacterium]|nr:RNA methyltransferase [Chitinophagales bacterium]MDW8427621.1 RNA methyltransferase [Chitinophagales bacterium]